MNRWFDRLSIGAQYLVTETLVVLVMLSFVFGLALLFH